MTAALLIIGSELTSGIISDSHSRLIAHDLSLAGIRVTRIVMIPDDGTIRVILGTLTKENDIVIVTGGLGPTSDDMTRRAIAEAAGVRLVQNPAVLSWLAGKVASVSGANEILTFFPEGFTPIDNPNGTAQGFQGFVGKGERKTFLVALPGPPREMDPMWEGSVLPQIRSYAGRNERESEYSVYLLYEAQLENLLEKCAVPGVAWGTRFQDYRISLYLSGPRGACASLAEKLGTLAGPGLVVEGDREAVTDLEDLLLAKKEMISCAESLTGGLVGKLLTDRAGSSEWYWGSANTYANSAKHAILGVSSDILDGVGPVSEECALAMAEGIRKISGTALSLSTTGYAGPTGEDVGKVWFGFSSAGRPAKAVCLRFTTRGREEIRRRASAAALILARAYREGEDIAAIAERWSYL